MKKNLIIVLLGLISITLIVYAQIKANEAYEYREQAKKMLMKPENKKNWRHEPQQMLLGCNA